MDNKKNGIPKLRFPGFTGAWEQRKFSEFATYSGKRNKDNLDLEPYAITSDNGFVRQSEAHNEFGYMKNTDRAAYKIVQSNSFGYNPARINIGSIGYYSGDKNIIVSSLYEVFKTNQDVNDEFLWIWFKSNRFQKWINKLQEGSVRLYFYYDKLRETKIQLPNLEEQRQVADLFTNLDSLIALHQRKLEHLQEQKKGLLQKMFPKNGEVVPEVRFPGFTDAWEQRKVSELLKERTEKAPESEIYPLMAFIANEGVAPKGDRYDRAALVKDVKNKKYKRTKLGDFIYSSNNLETGSIGLNNYGNASISPVYSIFKPTGIANSDFIGRRFVRKDFINSMVKWRQGVVYGQWRIHEKDFLKIVVPIPTLQEQVKIGHFLSELDSLIALHQRKLDHLELMKKGLLQQMFV